MAQVKKDLVAIIGTREPTESQQAQVIQEIRNLSTNQHRIISGCAYGVDALALQVGQECGFETIGIVPWSSYNRDIQEFCSEVFVIDELTPVQVAAAYASVDEHHPAPERLSQGARKLHARNYAIIRWAVRVIAAPSKDGGGTGQGIRLAESFGIPLTLIKETYPWVKTLYN